MPKLQMTLNLFLLLWRHLPNSLRPTIRKLYFGSVDSFNDSMNPPKRLVDFHAGGGDFERIGKEILEQLIDIGRLQAQETILDIGCGVGRIALALTEYLHGGHYEGFDIAPEGIEWCKKHISGRFPNFNFQVADIYNKFYNPHGRYKAHEYIFPYADNTIDFALLTSVFTHMVPKEMEHYISEISRVLKKDNGRCFFTYYLLDEETKQLMNENKLAFNFKFKIEEHCYTIFKDYSERAIAYDELFIRNLLDNYNLKLIEPIRYGSWRTDNTSSGTFQDRLIARTIS